MALRNPPHRKVRGRWAPSLLPKGRPNKYVPHMGKKQQAKAEARCAK